MTFDIKIGSQSGQYEITTDKKIFLNTENIFVLYDDYFSESYINSLIPESQKLAIKANEENKSLSMASEIFQEMVTARCNRNTLLIAVGGGAIQDLATLVASLYMRGIKWIYVPTTLMSILDSCIGGKSSINVGQYKNILGNIYPPEKIFIWTKFIDTLPKVDIACGLAEAGKICFAKSKNTFNEFLHWLQSDADSNFMYEKLAQISLNAKKWFIEIDEFDRKERKLLNFGHTFGHALEAASNFKLPHGIAVLIGMKTALFFAERNIDNLETFISETFANVKFDIGRVPVNKAKFESAISSDKKHSSQDMFFVLPDAVGQLSLVGFKKTNATLDKCWHSLINSLEDLDVEYEIL